MRRTKIIAAVLAAAAAFCLLTAPADAAKTVSFSDLPENHWAYGNVMKLTAAGVTGGYPDGSFRPDATVTEAEFLKMSVLACRNYSPGQAAEGAAWYSQYYAYVQKNWGGVWPTYISYQLADPNAEMSRYMVAYTAADVMTDNAEEQDRYCLETAGADSLSEIIPDLDEIDSYSFKVFNRFSSRVESCYAYGVLSGYEGGVFAGGRSVTRAEACSIICRLIYPETRLKANRRADYLARLLQERNDWLDARLAETIGNDMTEYEKATAIAVFIADYMSYGGGVSGTKGDPLISNRMGVCSDYSNKYLLLCRRAGITCTLITGYQPVYGSKGQLIDPGHAWNKVFADGTWYYVDTTWLPVLDGELMGSKPALRTDDSQHSSFTVSLKEQVFDESDEHAVISLNAMYLGYIE